MLTDRTVKLITEFDGWKYPNLHQHKFPPFTTYEVGLIEVMGLLSKYIPQ